MGVKVASPLHPADASNNPYFAFCTNYLFNYSIVYVVGNTLDVSPTFFLSSEAHKDVKTGQGVVRLPNAKQTPYKERERL